MLKQNPKFKQLQKIYSPKRDKFKLSQKPIVNTKCGRPPAACLPARQGEAGNPYQLLKKSKTIFQNFLRNATACVFSICEKCKLTNNNIQNSKVSKNTKPTYTTLLYSNVAKVKLMFKRVYLKKIFALITIIAVIITTYLQFTPQTQAATDTLYQTA